MKTTTEPMFSNGNEHLQWEARNCDRCVKKSHYVEKRDDWTAFKCSIDRDIQAQICGLMDVNLKSFAATRGKDCPYIQLERKLPKKRPLKNQLNLWN